jgi:alpha-tubulin suppressor-like RCC1 family protein
MYYTGKMNEYDSETWTHLMMGKRFTNVISAGPMLYGLSKEGVVFKLDTIKDETIGIREIRNKKIVQLVAGKNHVLAMDEKGATHTWQATPTARVTRTGLSKASYIAAGGNTCVALSNSLQL